MMNDIAALQYMYGADYGTNRGNTRYTWSPTTGQMFVDGIGQFTPYRNYIYMTVWDGGGTDTYDFSNYTGGVNVDLRPGFHSVTSTSQLANVDGNDGNQVARGNIFNALVANGDLRSVIENVLGSSGNDTLGGNGITNILNGGLGADRMEGRAGDNFYVVDNAGDIVIEAPAAARTRSSPSDSGTAAISLLGNELANQIFGNAGANVLDGKGGVDQMTGNGGNDIYYVDNGADRMFESADGGTAHQRQLFAQCREACRDAANHQRGRDGAPSI